MTYKVCDFCGQRWPSNKLTKRKGRYLCPICWDEGDYEEFTGIAEEEPEGIVIGLGWWTSPQPEEGLLLIDERTNLNVMSNVEDGMVLTYEPETAPFRYRTSSPYTVINEPFTNVSGEEDFLMPGRAIVERQWDNSLTFLNGSEPEGILIYHEDWPFSNLNPYIPDEEAGILLRDDIVLYEGIEDENGIAINFVGG